MRAHSLRRDGVVAAVLALLAAAWALAAGGSTGLSSAVTGAFAAAWPSRSASFAAGQPRAALAPELSAPAPAFPRAASMIDLSAGSPAPLAGLAGTSEVSAAASNSAAARQGLSSTLSQAHRSINEAITPVGVSAPDPGAQPGGGAPAGAAPTAAGQPAVIKIPVAQAAAVALGAIAAQRAQAAAAPSRPKTWGGIARRRETPVVPRPRFTRDSL